jgi:two-component system response regulator AtoC
VSINFDVDAPSVPFVPRPWPRRLPEDSPLRGQRVLLLGKDPAVARNMAEALSQSGASAQTATVGPRLERVLTGTTWEVVVADVEVLDADVCELLRELDPQPVILLAGSQGEAHVADDGADAEPKSVDTLGSQIHAYLHRPISEAELLVSVGGALEQRSLTQENQRLRESLADRFSLGNFATRAPAMRRILVTAGSVADTRANVLLSGESGTGKTRLAQTIHQLSSRRAEPFVVVNCGSLPGQLLESELFGHVRGAFTGAVRDKPGRFELADRGTIFLDEINSASLDLQVKLLRVIQDRSFERVGDPQVRQVDVRIITASNRDLQQEIAAGRFRDDLYYRINVVALEVPPLRDRPGDTPLLVDLFLKRYAQEYGKRLRGLAPDALAMLVAHPWPGNVRQLENAIERAVLVAQGAQLQVTDFSADLAPAPGLGATAHAPLVADGESLTIQIGLKGLSSLKEALELPEREIIRHALQRSDGNRKKTAEFLAVNRTTLFNKMKKYGLMDGGHGEE